MSDIKLKKEKKGTIKVLDKTKVGTEKLKDKIIKRNEDREDSGEIYATDKISNTMKNLPNNMYKYNKIRKIKCKTDNKQYRRIKRKN